MITVIPAYGRDYKSEHDVLVDWRAGKDFLMVNQSRSYINISDAEKFGVPQRQIRIRYNRKRSLVIVKVNCPTTMI